MILSDTEELPLYQLFVDMSVLVETQGEMLDQIEYSVQQVRMGRVAWLRMGRLHGWL